jgi:hypothetical protein
MLNTYPYRHTFRRALGNCRFDEGFLAAARVRSARSSAARSSRGAQQPFRLATPLRPRSGFLATWGGQMH